MKRKLKTTALSLWLILAVALGVRALYAWNQARHVPGQVLATVSFAQENGNIAQALVEGRGFSDPFRQGTGPTAWLAPVYPLLLAGIFRVFGIFTVGAFWAAVALNILCSAGVCVPLFFAGKRIGGTTLAAAAAWLWALFPNAVILPFAWIWATSLAALLAATILWATLALQDSRRTRNWIGYGVLWGLALLTMPPLGALAPFLFLWLAWRRRPGNGRAWLAQPALAVAVVLLCLVPWTARNYARFHRFVPVRSAFPFALWVGNNNVVNPHGRDVMARITTYGQVREYVRLGETPFLQRKWREAAEFIAGHKRLELWLTWRRLVAMWLGSPNPVIAFRDATSAFIRFLYVVNALATLGALAGIVALYWKRSLYAFPVSVCPVVFPCVYYVTLASLRYRNPIDPAVILLCAAALVALFRSATGSGDPAGRPLSNTPPTSASTS
jgi:hypothetical protein